MSNPTRPRINPYSDAVRNLPGVEQMVDMRAQRISKATETNTQTITYATNEINKLAGEDRIQIPEDIFKRYFLPFFAGEEGNYPESAYEEWLKISANGISPVDVVDAAGNVVVTMPARYARSLVNIRTQRSGTSLFDAMATFSDLAVSSPIRAINYFNRVIQPNTNTEDARTNAIKKYVDDITIVLKHYGKNTELSNTTDSGTKSKVSTNDSQDRPVFDYSDADLL